MNIIPLILFGGVICCNVCNVVAQQKYPIRRQPEFDRFDISKIFKNEKVMKIQFKCLMFDAPCDIFGKFVKPRAKSALKGICEQCTPLQETLMQDWFMIFKDKFPEMHELAVKKFIDYDGKELPEELKAEIKKVFSDEAITNYQKVYNEFADRLPGGTGQSTTTTTPVTPTTTETSSSSSAPTSTTTNDTPTVSSETTTTPTST